MSARLRAHVEAALRSARAAETNGDAQGAWLLLERAHVLSQAYAGAHVRVHLRMLAFGWRRRDAREIWGQVVRVLVAAPGSWLGRAPLGNTGGANVGILTPLPIAPELQALLELELEPDEKVEAAGPR